MLEKIISGGQTGADRAALDVAIKYNIPHGGWIPLGRTTEDGPLPGRYRLRQMASPDYRDRTRQNIIDSHGTVIFSREPLHGGSRLTLEFASIARRPHIHVNLTHNDAFEAAVIVQSFIRENQIRLLNVAGPRASHDPGIYQDVKTILEAALYLFYLDGHGDDHRSGQVTFPEPVAPEFPEDILSAVYLLADDLALRDKVFIARQDDSRVRAFYFAWLDIVRARLGFDQGNDRLLADCKSEGMPDFFTVEDGVMEIIKALKRFCEKSFLLKVVK